MYNVCKDGAVGRRVALQREEVMKWQDNGRYVAVVNHLADAGNPEACFIVGLPLVFTHQAMQRGLVCLERAAVGGHKAAAYVLGLLLYMGDESRDVAKHYISQVEGESAGGGCETAKRTNLECRRYRKLAADAVKKAWWKMDGPLGRVWAFSEDGHRCTNTDCGVIEGWDDYIIFCSDDCRIRHEYAKFFAEVLNFLP